MTPKIKTNRGEKGVTNLELSGASRTVRAASEPLSRRLIPKLCPLSPHSSQAEGGSNLEDKKKGDNI